MELWTLCKERGKWKSSFVLRKWDSMGNVVDKIDEQKGSPLTRQDYPDDFLEQIADVFETYAFEVDEYESYENDDNDTSGEYERQYVTDLSPKDMVVISNGVPVGFMVESKDYNRNKTTFYGTVLYFHNAGTAANSYTIEDQTGRWRSRRTYTLIKRK